MTEKGKWVWRDTPDGSRQCAARLVRSVGPFGLVRESWEWLLKPVRKPWGASSTFASVAAANQWLALLNGESLPDRYNEGYYKGYTEGHDYGREWGYKAGRKDFLYAQTTEALEAELARRKPITSGYSVPVNGICNAGSTITFTYFDTEVLERRKADRRKDVARKEAGQVKPKKRKTRP